MVAMNPAPAVSGRAENARESARVVKLSVAAGDAGERLDRFLAAQLPELSRTRIQSLVDHGRVTVNGAPGKRSYRVESGDAVVLEIPAPSTAAAQPEAIPLEILYQDGDVAVVNKPAGMIVHPGAGVKSGTIVNALLHEFGRGASSLPSAASCVQASCIASTGERQACFLSRGMIWRIALSRGNSAAAKLKKLTLLCFTAN